MNTLLRCLYQREGITHFAKVLWLLISFCGGHLRVAAKAVLSCSQQQPAASYLQLLWSEQTEQQICPIRSLLCPVSVSTWWILTFIQTFQTSGIFPMCPHLSGVSGWSRESTIYSIYSGGAGIKYSPAGGSRRPWIRHRISQYVRQNLDKYKSQPARTRENFEKILFLSGIGLLLTVLNMRIKQRSRAEQ